MSKPRVGVVHTFLYSVEDIKAQFKKQLPEVEMINIIDDSLLEEALANKGLTPGIINRMCDYYSNLQDLGCVCALNQCSSVGEASDIAGKIVNMPIVKIDGPMAEEAVKLGTSIAVIATAISTVEPSSRLVESKAKQIGKDVVVDRCFVEGAYHLYLIEGADKAKFDALDIPVSGTFDDLLDQVDIMLDSSPGGVGAKNKELYAAKGVKAVFQGGEKNSVADVFFHGYANYEKGIGQNYLKLTSCNTTGLIRAVDCLDREFGIKKVAITIIRRVADPGDYHRGLTNALQMEKAPSHQAVDLMTIMPHVDATGILVHTPVTHGHIITVLATGKKKITKEMALNAFQKHPRIRMVNMDEGFLGNASLFRYARDLGNSRGDMYEIALWEDSIVESGDDIMFAINIPQESVTIPESLDAVRAACNMQATREEGTAKTNEYLKIGRWK